MSFDLDFIIVGLFLAITLAIGLFFFGKVKSLRDYALGSGEFVSIVLFSTLSATVVGGYRIMGVAGKIYDSGIIYFITSSIQILLSKQILDLLLECRRAPTLDKS